LDHQQQEQQGLNGLSRGSSAPTPTAAATAAGAPRIVTLDAPPRPSNGGRGSTAAPASPSPTALARSASAEYELEGSAGVYSAAEEGGHGLGAPGRMVKPSEGRAAVNHFGSAPEAVSRDGEGRVHSGRGALAAAAAGEAITRWVGEGAEGK
jgi:hypothetical protein